MGNDFRAPLFDNSLLFFVFQLNNTQKIHKKTKYGVPFKKKRVLLFSIHQSYTEYSLIDDMTI